MLQGALSGDSRHRSRARLLSCQPLPLRSLRGRPYATVFFGILDQEGHLEFINAGILRPFSFAAVPPKKRSLKAPILSACSRAEYTAFASSSNLAHPGALQRPASLRPWIPTNRCSHVALKELLNASSNAPSKQLQKCVLEAVKLRRGVTRRRSDTSHRSLPCHAPPSVSARTPYVFCFFFLIFLTVSRCPLRLIPPPPRPLPPRRRRSLLPPRPPRPANCRCDALVEESFSGRLWNSKKKANAITIALPLSIRDFFRPSPENPSIL